MSSKTSDKFKEMERTKEEIAIAMIQDGEPFDKIEISTKISLDRILQLAEKLKSKEKSQYKK